MCEQCCNKLNCKFSGIPDNEKRSFALTNESPFTDEKVGNMGMFDLKVLTCKNRNTEV